jgi:hypothetical protein
MIPTRFVVPLITAILVIATGCAAQKVQRPTALAIELNPPAVEEPVRFELTASEWQAVEPYLPNLSATADHDLCKDGVPAFVVEFLDRPAGAAFAKGYFFHGPDQLIVALGASADQRELDHQTRFHSAILDVVRARGYSLTTATP